MEWAAHGGMGGTEGGDKERPQPCSPWVCTGEGRKPVSRTPSLSSHPASLLCRIQAPCPSSRGHKLNKHPYKEVTRCQVCAGNFTHIFSFNWKQALLLSPFYRCRN